MTSPNSAVTSDGNTAPVILSVAFPYAPIGPKAVGGAEVICSQLEAALPQLGFRSVVVAHAESQPAGKLYPTHVPQGVITDDLRATVEANQQHGIDRALAEHPVALVHMHGLDFDRYRIPPHIPVVVTLHLPAAWYPERIWQLPPNVHFVCVSEHQRRSCPASAQLRLAVVGNGVPLPDRANLRPKGNYALMLARICPEKNLHIGFDAARLADMPAMLAGEVFPYEAHLRYLEDEIKPRLTAVGPTAHIPRQLALSDDPPARFLGPVAGEEKQRLLLRAACLLLPSLAPETSSLVAMEALAAGIPVVGMAVGAVPEIIEHGHTGFLIAPGHDASAHLAEALDHVATLDRRLCRAVAEERFPLSRMLSSYAALYRERALATPSTLIHAHATPQVSPSEAFAPPQARPVPAHLSDTAALHAVAPEWITLWNADPSATPFQHPAWLLPWWRQFGPDGALAAVALRNPSTQSLAGLLPTYIYPDPASGTRQLLLLGAGTSDYLGGIWSPDASDAAETALHFLLAQNSGWTNASLHQQRAGSPLLQAAIDQGLLLSSSEPCSTLPTAPDLRAKMRVNLNRYRRLAAAQGDLQCHLACTHEEASTAFNDLVALHTNRWKERGEEGVLHDPRVLAHHRESLPRLLDAGLLRLFHLTLGGETLGVLYALADGPQAADRRLYLYLIGFDARFAALSPGSLLVHEAWLHAREHGFPKLDLLRGGESYKHLWGAVPEPTSAINLTPSPTT